MNEKIAAKLIQHDKALGEIKDSMVTKKEHQDVLDSLDQILRIVKRLDQERTFSNQWAKGVNKDIEKQEQEIIKIKKAVNVS